jgi:hypothetical protein
MNRFPHTAVRPLPGRAKATAPADRPLEERSDAEMLVPALPK